MTGQEKINSLWHETVEPSILEQYRSSNRWKGVLKSVIDKLQVIDDDAVELLAVFKTDGDDMPTGYRLDWIAGLLNVRRNPGESDDSLFARFEETANKKNAGTPDNVIGIVALLSGDPSPSYVEDVPGRFLVYTHDFRQVSQRAVKRISPSGFCGASAARFKCADGKFLMIPHGDSSYKSLLCVADDRTIGSETTKMVVTSDNKIVTTEDGKILTTERKF